MLRLRRALAVFFPLCFAGCSPQIVTTSAPTAGGAHVAISNGGSVITVTGTLIALPGHTLRIGFFHDPQNADCSVQGDQHIVFTVVAQPQHGTLDVESELDFPAYPENSLMFRCSSGRIPGTEVTYLAAPGFFGADQFSYSVYFPNGHEMIANTTVNVQP